MVIDDNNMRNVGEYTPSSLEMNKPHFEGLREMRYETVRTGKERKGSEERRQAR